MWNICRLVWRVLSLVVDGDDDDDDDVDDNRDFKIQRRDGDKDVA